MLESTINLKLCHDFTGIVCMADITTSTEQCLSGQLPIHIH